MFYPQEIIEEIRLSNDIVEVISGYTLLKQKGGSYMGLCPFHNEKSASFSVSAEKQIFHCFGCGVSGNVISFIMQIENYDFIDTIKHLASKVNYSLPEPQLSEEMKRKAIEKNTLYDIQRESARFFYANLISAKGTIAKEYLHKRGIDSKISKKFGLGFSLRDRNSLFNYLLEKGYDIDLILKSGLVIRRDTGEYVDRFFNRLMFPIFDTQGKIIAFGGRVVDKGEPKYLNSPETLLFNKSNSLYSINYARLARKEEIIIVEGYMDVISLYQAGFTNVVAALGTAFTEDHAKLLKKYTENITLVFDSDEAGTKAILRAIPILIRHGLKLKVLQVTNAKDPDDYIKKFGCESFGNLLENAKSYISFQINTILKKYNLEKADQKVLFTIGVAKILSKIDNAIEQDVYISEVANLTGISKNAIETEILKISDNKDMQSKIPQYKNRTTELIDTTKNIDEARRSILYLLVTDYYIYKKLSNLIKAEEFVESVYIKLCQNIYSRYEKNDDINIADLISCFETVLEQQTVSNIFVNKFDYADKNIKEKAINDQIKLIKNEYIDYKMQELKTKDDILELQTLIKQKNNVKNWYITLSDG